MSSYTKFSRLINFKQSGIRVLVVLLFSFTVANSFAQGPYDLEMISVTSVGGQVIDTIGIIPKGGAVYAGEDNVILKMVRNNDFSWSDSSITSDVLYFTILEVLPNGEVSLVVPNRMDNQDPQEFVVRDEGPSEFMLFNTVTGFAPPYGQESFVILYSMQPLKFFGNRNVPTRGTNQNYLTVEDVKWLLQGNSIEGLGEVFISTFQFEIRSREMLDPPVSGGRGSAGGGSEDVDEDGWGSSDDWGDEEGVTQIVERHLIQNEEIYVKYPILSMISPPEPSWESSGRGIQVDEYESHTTAFVVKGTSSSKEELDEVVIYVEDASGDQRSYRTKNFRKVPQGVLFEDQVQIAEGENTIVVQVKTNQGYGVKQEFKVISTLDDKASAGQDHLLIMSVNDYLHWPKLKNAVNDAKAMKELLQKNYGFADSTTYTLTNEQCTRRAIDSTFRDLMRSLDENDRLMVYFAGHGYYDSLTDVGYWIPFEAETGEYATYSYVSNSIISEYIKGLKTRHTLFVSDACFSGNLCVAEGRGIDDKYTASMDQFKSRWIFSSGRSEVVADEYLRTGHSPFAHFLLTYMQQPPNEVFTISELAAKVSRNVANNANQKPMARAIKNSGDEGGEFIFRFKQ